ncbi:MAG TPA: tripartite tricarboxylate transporter substrate binding protein [Ruminiclostridium sp.]|jgi:tripartite-type tricarboxylate transporter receptor subunit TctC|nr:tripartite tricarboxylate transporter substrate binding protein [Ruminiclostridium sp.]
MRTRKTTIVLAIIMLAAILVSGCGSKQFPGKNINVTIQYSAGGPTDMSVRGLLDVAGKNLPKGVSFVPANKTGAGGIIGMTETAKAKTDGYNIGVISVDLLMHHYLGKTDLTKDDFIPLAVTMADPYGLVVNAKAGYQTVDEFIAYAKDHPGEVTVGNSAAGGAPHLAALAFEKQFGLKFKHVAYDGSAECIAAIAGGHLDATFTQPSPAKAQMDAGQMKMLAIMDEKRMESFPDVPTVNETQKIDFNMRGWVMIAAPAGMSEEHIAYFKDLFTNAVKDSKYKEVIASLGMQPVEYIGDDITKMLNEDDAFYKELCSGLDIN